MKKIITAAMCAAAFLPAVAMAQNAPVASATQSGSGNTIEEKQEDAQSRITVTQAGAGNFARASQYHHSGSVAEIEQAASVSNSKAYIYQTTNGLSQHGSKAIVTQQNANGGFASIYTNGSNNLATIVQKATTFGVISQTGSGNSAKVDQQAAGDAREQTGDYRTHPVSLVQVGDGNTAYVQQLGANNTSYVRQGDFYGTHSNGSTLALYQRGAGNAGEVTQNGDGNALIASQNGFESTLLARQIGNGIGLDVFQAADHSLITTNQTGDGASATLKQTGGSNNRITLAQDVAGGRATAVQSGVGNAITISQTGYVPPIQTVSR